MRRILKHLKGNRKIPLLTGSIVALLLIVAIVTPLASENASAALWRSKTSSSITLKLSTSSPGVGASVHADGVLVGTTGISSAQVALKVTLPDGTVAYPTQGSYTYTSSGGKFGIDYTPAKVGLYKITASFGGNSRYASTTSTASFSAVAVQTPSDPTPSKSASLMTLTTASSTIETGNSMVASGSLMGTTAIAGATVSMSVTLPDGSTAYPTQGPSTVTDSSGKFSMNYVPATAGTYKFTASFAGNDQNNGSSVSASFTASDPASSTPAPPAPSTSYSYIVTNVGGTYYAKNAATGATISSGTNAATVIQAALNALTPGRTAKEAVLLQGDFTLTKALSIPSYTILELSGKLTMASGSNTHMIFTSGKSNIEIVGGEWDGNQAGQTSGGSDRDGMIFVNCQYVTIRDLKIHDTPYDNVACQACSYVTISNIESYNAGVYSKGGSYWGHGIMMLWCNDCLVEKNYIHDTNSGGCYFYCEDDGVAQTINNNVVQNNRIERTATTGIEISLRGAEDRASNVIVRNNTMVDCGWDSDHMAITLGWDYQSTIRYADHCTVRDNTIYETGAYYSSGGCGGGIMLNSVDSVCTNNIVRDIYDGGIACRGDRNIISYNTVSGIRSSSGSGIQLWDGNNNEIVNNNISKCYVGVDIWIGATTGCNQNHIAYNTFSAMTGSVVAIHESGSTGNIIESNTFVGSSSINNRGTGTVIKNNTVTK